MGKVLKLGTSFLNTPRDLMALEICFMGKSAILNTATQLLTPMVFQNLSVNQMAV